MKILIFSGYLSPKLNANNKIALTVAEEMALAGHDVTIAGINADEHAFSTLITASASRNVRCVYITPNEYYLKEREKLGKYLSHSGSRVFSAAKYCFLHPVSAAKALYSYSPFYKSVDMETEAVRFLNKFCNAEQFDCIIAVTFPKFTLPIVFDGIKTNCKKAIYQLDPLGVHEDNTDDNRDQLQQFELEYFRQADYIFTTDILKDVYCKTKEYCNFSNKIFTAQFPTLAECHSADCPPVPLCNDKTNIVFCGTVDDRYRSPEIFLRCMEKIWSTDKNIAVHFVGINYSNLTLQYAEKYPENVFVHPRIETEYVPALLSNADILLNIGNTYRLQVPSKIFEYFGTCKPIIHQKVIKDCSCVQYMEKYPLAFCFDSSNDACAEKLYEFIKNCDTSVNWQIISDIFKDNLPHNVALKILDTIK